MFAPLHHVLLAVVVDQGAVPDAADITGPHRLAVAHRVGIPAALRHPHRYQSQYDAEGTPSSATPPFTDRRPGTDGGSPLVALTLTYATTGVPAPVR
ncbi:hypothetical protein ACTPOK_00880 [Streptomyces inhibens]|uniref:hypothetical protein n=1 Tax=Streptomyces inhibens TaxID=2293571 RepID=UPI00402AD9E7